MLVMELEQGSSIMPPWPTITTFSLVALYDHSTSTDIHDCLLTGLQSPDPQPPPETLKYQIDLAFSSMDSLRDTFIATGNAMFGPGYVWLVAVPNLSGGTSRKLAILNTYNAGTPFPTAHYRLQNKDLATTDMGVRAGENPTQYSSRNGQRHGSFGIHSKSNRESGIWSEPITLLMCISTWQHVWLQDWGVQGKEDYLNAIWNAIDWKAVDKNYGSPEKRTRSS